ncbi:MAG: putative nucleoside permease NupX [Myxococcota bacterium]|nr:putative nucleoside permease NupX [Myxococcota bacterium]
MLNHGFRRLALRAGMVFLCAWVLMVPMAGWLLAQDAPAGGNDPAQSATPAAAADNPADTAPSADKAPEIKPETGERKTIKADLKSLPAATAYDRIMAVVGTLFMIGVAWLFSTSRRAVNWRLVGMGVALQGLMAVFILRTSAGQTVFQKMADGVSAILEFSKKGEVFIFGDWPDVVVVTNGITGKPFAIGFVFAVKVLPTIVFVSSLFTLLYHWGVLQRVVGVFAFAMEKILKVSGAEALSASANVFMGQTEAPLLIKPYVPAMTTSELFAVMTGGMATIAGAVMVAYIGFGVDAVHLLSASFMSAPAGLVIAKIMVPETGSPATMGGVKVEVPRLDVNMFDAAARGASEGLQLAINVGAMLLAFIALTALANGLLGLLDENIIRMIAGRPVGLSIEMILGWIGAPVALVMGIPPSEALAVGKLIGVKTGLNEFIGYLELTKMAGEGVLSPRSQVIAIYALCGFSNFGSMAIQMGGIGGIAPSRRPDIARLALRSVLSGTLACLMTATMAALIA